MGGIEKLTRFQYHFDHVLVEVPTGCLSGLPMEGEDIHGGGPVAPRTPLHVFQFLIAWRAFSPLSLLWRRRGFAAYTPLSVYFKF